MSDAPTSKALSEAHSPVPLTMPVPTSDGMARPAELNGMPDTKLSAPEVNLETIPSSTPSGSAAQSTDSGAPAHRETEDAAQEPIPTAAPDSRAKQVVAVVVAAAAAAPSDELPPLPAALGGPETSKAVTEAVRPSQTPIVSPQPAATPENVTSPRKAQQCRPLPLPRLRQMSYRLCRLS